MADGLHGQGRQGRARSGRRQQPQQQFRSGRQEAGGDLAQYADAGTGTAAAAAPLSNYGANDAGLNDAAGAGDDNLVSKTLL